MRLLHTVTLVLACAAAVHTADIQASIVQHEVRTQALPHWSLHSAAAPEDHVLNMRIAVKQSESGLSEVEQYVLSHSANPQSERFGHHLTQEQVNRMVAPPAHRVNAVVDWLSSHGITEMEHTAGSDFIKFSAPVSVANKLLHTEYKQYRHVGTGELAVRTDAYHVPEHIQQHIDYVSPTIHMPQVNHKKQHIQSVGAPVQPLRKLQAANSGSYKKPSPPHGAPIQPPADTLTLDYGACSNVTTPQCLRLLYNFADYTPTEATNGKNAIAVTEYIGQYAELNNLYLAQQQFVEPYYGKQAARSTFTVVGNGGDPQGNETLAGGEADLDIQVVSALPYPTPVTMYSTVYDGVSDSVWNDWLDTVVGQPNLPPVISTSYGDDETGDTYNYATRVCYEFMELAAQGITILFSSGDDGVGGNLGCAGKTHFVPTFPASCPWVTTVGATELFADGTERAVNYPNDPSLASYTSGGGFSNYFPTPSWQQTAVSEYLSKQTTSTKWFNPSGRGYPDVSAIGAVAYPVYTSNCIFGGACDPNNAYLIPIGGTSLASPVFASVLALINDQRIKNGLGTLGFINPALYAQPSSLKDITQGYNWGCGSNGELGFQTAAGWDPVTGLGAPDFSTLSPYLSALGTPAPSTTGTPYPSADFIDNDPCENSETCTPPPAGKK